MVIGGGAEKVSFKGEIGELIPREKFVNKNGDWVMFIGWEVV